MYFPSYFKNLLNFGYQRRGLEVPTFYFVYLIGSIMAGAVIGMTISGISGSDAIRINYRIDFIVASILFLVITHFIIRDKHLGDNIKIIWLLPLAAAALTIYIGHTIALIIPTVLSAVANKNQANKSTTEKSKDQSDQAPSNTPDSTNKTN